MLHKTFYQSHIVMESLKDTQIITDQEIENQFNMLVEENNNNLLLAQSSEDWFPYCDGISYCENSEQMIAIFDKFSDKCACQNESFKKRLEEV